MRLARKYVPPSQVLSVFYDALKLPPNRNVADFTGSMHQSELVQVLSVSASAVELGVCAKSAQRALIGVRSTMVEMETRSRSLIVEAELVERSLALENFAVKTQIELEKKKCQKVVVASDELRNRNAIVAEEAAQYALILQDLKWEKIAEEREFIAIQNFIFDHYKVHSVGTDQRKYDVVVKTIKAQEPFSRAVALFADAEATSAMERELRTTVSNPINDVLARVRTLELRDRKIKEVGSGSDRMGHKMVKERDECRQYMCSSETRSTLDAVVPKSP